MSKLPSPFNTQASGLVSIIDNGKLHPMITCTRSSPATYMDSKGLPRQAGVNCPRMEYDTSGKLIGLLTEGTRTNLMPFSEDPVANQNGWSTPNATLGASTMFGDMKFTKVTENTLAGHHAIRTELRNLETTMQVSFRRFVKYDAGSPKAARFVSFLVVPVTDIVDTWYACHVDLTTGEYVTAQNGTPTSVEWLVLHYPESGITQVGTIFTTPSTPSVYIPYYDVRFSNATKLDDFKDTHGRTYVGTGQTFLSGGIHQENYSSVCSSYIKNTAGPSTRAADDIRLAGLPVGHDFTVLVECSKYSQFTFQKTEMVPVAYGNSDTGETANPRKASIQVTFRYDAAVPMSTLGDSSSASYTSMAKQYDSLKNKFKFAYTIDMTRMRFNWALDGSASKEGIRGGYGLASANGLIYLGKSAQDSSPWFGHIQKVVAWPQTMDEYQLQFLTQ